VLILQCFYFLTGYYSAYFILNFRILNLFNFPISVSDAEQKMNMPKNSLVKYWLLQAQDDFRWLVQSHLHRQFYQVCIFAQQVGIKSLKAISVSQDLADDIGSSIRDAGKKFEVGDEIIEAGVFLDKFYINSKDHEKAENPFDAVNEEIADQAHEYAKLILEKTKIITEID